MDIQSLSIVVPGTKCINNCKFCVSRTHEDIIYDDYINDLIPDLERVVIDTHNLTIVGNANNYTTALSVGECDS